MLNTEFLLALFAVYARRKGAGEVEDADTVPASAVWHVTAQHSTGDVLLDHLCFCTPK